MQPGLPAWLLTEVFLGENLLGLQLAWHWVSGAVGRLLGKDGKVRLGVQAYLPICTILRDLGKHPFLPSSPVCEGSPAGDCPSTHSSLKMAGGQGWGLLSTRRVLDGCNWLLELPVHGPSLLLSLEMP